MTVPHWLIPMGAAVLTIGIAACDQRVMPRSSSSSGNRGPWPVRRIRTSSTSSPSRCGCGRRRSSRT
jgi:hypothetical protein